MASTADKQAKLRGAMSRAKKLIQLESNGTLDKIAAGVRNGVDSSLNGDVMIEQLMTTPRDRKREAPVVTRRMSENAMNVPAAIRESFAKMPIDTSNTYQGYNGQGNDDLGFLNEGLEERPIVTQTQNVKQIVSEGLGNQQQYPLTGQQIDYPMIRTIVEEIVRKYTVSLKNKLISEGKNSNNEINTITLGNTFKFLANDGTIYECTMKKIGNINNKKKNVNG